MTAASATPSAGDSLLGPIKHKVKFDLMVPTILERSSYPDTLPGDKPVRRYYIQGRHRAVRLVFRTSANEFWGIQETDWNDAPILGQPSFEHKLHGRIYDFYYSGPHLHMIVLKENGATYWVVNTILDSLSNEHLPVNLGNPDHEVTMLELAQTCVRVTSSSSEIVFEALPMDDPLVRRPDITRARQILGWEPEIDLEDGLRRWLKELGREPVEV